MIQTFVDRFMAAKPQIEAEWRVKRPDGYGEIVKRVIEAVTGEQYSTDPSPDPERIHSIDDGDYQGTLVFVIAEKGYQPSDYYYVKVWYGSCSGCDTLQAIQGYGDEITEEEVAGVMTLALHIVQGLKKMGDHAE